MQKIINMKEIYNTLNIPYSYIDREMIELLYIFNILLNIETKFCCFGHYIYSGGKNERTYIMFSDNVEEKKIIQLVNFLANNTKLTKLFKLNHISINREIRLSYYYNKVIPLDNWILNIDYLQRNMSKNHKKKIIKNFKRILYKYYETMEINCNEINN